MNKDRQIYIFNKRAKKITCLDFSKRKIFAEKYRKQLLDGVSGKILEVSIGTGANFRYYPHLAEITAVDFSDVLLNIAERNSRIYDLKIEFINSDVENLSFAENSFDSIVSTLSLCSYEYPIKVLNNFNKWCKPHGKIFLLEHGLSSGKFYGSLINILLNFFNRFSKKFLGDNINYDIIGIISKSNLSIKQIVTFFFKTHYLILASPKKGM